jgi:type VI protein secretion system component VasK
MEGVSLLFWIVGGLALGWWGVTQAHWHPLLGVFCPIVAFVWGLVGLIKMEQATAQQRLEEGEAQAAAVEEKPVASQTQVTKQEIKQEEKNSDASQ